MIQYLCKKIRNKKGFTLIELIVVIAVLGILAGVAVPRFTGASDRARESAHAANVRTLEGAAAMYLAENGNPSSNMNEVATKEVLEGEYVNEYPKSPWDDGDEYTVTISKEGEVKVGGGEKSSSD